MDVDNDNGIVKNTNCVNSANEFSTELLEIYYKRLFPYDAMFDWLSYGIFIYYIILLIFLRN